jgi:hypothetical protein
MNPKAFFLTLLLLVIPLSISPAQQWSGSTTLTGDIHRNGPISLWNGDFNINKNIAGDGTSNGLMSILFGPQHRLVGQLDVGHLGSRFRDDLRHVSQL